MTTKFEIVVSAENNAYMAWQCQLFHYSCVSRAGVVPTFFVHDTGAQWDPGFLEISRAGGRVHRVPTYRFTAGGATYVPRNTPGTLLHAAHTFAGATASLLLCDPDMIFLSKPQVKPVLSGSHYPEMNYDKAVVRTAAERCGVAANQILSRQELCIGVPHSVPIDIAAPLANAWLQAIDQFELTIWEISMYALGIAAVNLGVPVSINPLVGSERRMAERANGQMIHYCYPGDLWVKHGFYSGEDARRVWDAEGEAPPGTIMAELLTQLSEARHFYSRIDL